MRQTARIFDHFAPKPEQFIFVSTWTRNASVEKNRSMHTRDITETEPGNGIL